MKGKTAIVTGGASGMGEAVVRQLLDKGANILAVDRDPRALERLVARSGCDRLIPVEADIALEATAAALVETCRGKFGNVRFLVNCAGITRMPVPFEATQLSDFELVGAVNLRGTFLTMRAVIPHMKESGGGSIVNISSTAGIRVNVVCPGITDTPMLHGIAGDYTAELAAGTPMRRIGKPEEIANAVTWLLSDAASFVTGVVMPVDGGLALV
jgi:NAD(P)-dependent dehydrogenase (short-subunit alcohol dehydrogenase family)